MSRSTTTAGMVAAVLKVRLLCFATSTPQTTLGDTPKYNLRETTRPLIEAHWSCAGRYLDPQRDAKDPEAISLHAFGVQESFCMCVYICRYRIHMHVDTYIYRWYIDMFHIQVYIYQRRGERPKNSGCGPEGIKSCLEEPEAHEPDMRRGTRI